jgi:NAD(P)-dependent dehydrogenase (short-subunit alcohol dehydrogenase family)
MKVELSGKVAVVTGAGQGIGRAYANALAAAGAAVAVAEIDSPRGEETAKSIVDDGGTAIFVQTDVSDEGSTRHMGETVIEQLGGVDILVNNAGLWGAVTKDSILDLDIAYWDKVMAINLTGMLLCARAVVPSMIARGGGTIVNQSSIGAFIASPKMPHYCTSKAGVNALTKTMAKDFGQHGIRVNAIAPGSIATEATMGQIGEVGLERIVSTQALKRAGQTDDLTGPLLFLVSDLSGFVTGQVLVVDGGVVMLG